jgi:cytochrome b561
MLALVMIHVAAALRHHYLLRDRLLARMSFRAR